MITNYTELKTEVADFAHRIDITPKMDTFCQLAEDIINNGYEHPSGKKIPGLRSLEMEKRAAQSFNATFYALPSDYLEMIALEMEYHGRRNPLRQVSPQILDQTYSVSTGSPRAYTIRANEIEFRPGVEASSPYTGELTYFYKVPTLTSNSTNDVLDKQPMIYLNAMMLILNVYLHDEEQRDVWFGLLNGSIRGANGKGRYVLPKVEVC